MYELSINNLNENQAAIPLTAMINNNLSANNIRIDKKLYPCGEKLDTNAL